MALNSIVTIGKLAYDIAKDSHSVIDVNDPPYAHVVPQDSFSTRSLEWRREVKHISLLPNKEGTFSIRRSTPFNNFSDESVLLVSVYMEWQYSGLERIMDDKTRTDGCGYILNATTYCKVLKADNSTSFSISTNFGQGYNIANPNWDGVVIALPFTITFKSTSRALAGIIKGQVQTAQIKGEIYGYEDNGSGVIMYETV